MGMLRCPWMLTPFYAFILYLLLILSLFISGQEFHECVFHSGTQAILLLSLRVLCVANFQYVGIC